MAIDNNSFCWNGIVSTDIEGSKAFYNAAIEWQTIEHSFPDGSSATMFAAADFPRAHLRAPETGPLGQEPCRWSSYLRVADVDASTAASTANGGSVLVPPTDIAPGRFSSIATPSGALLCLYHELDEETAANGPPGVGSIHWTELQSNDVEADREWLTATFGFEIEEMPMPEGGTYYILMSGGKPRGGVCPAFNDAVAGRWLVWVQVDDVDDAILRVEGAGGSTVTGASDFPGVGRMAIVEDPTGAVFGMITPASS